MAHYCSFALFYTSFACGFLHRGRTNPLPCYLADKSDTTETAHAQIGGTCEPSSETHEMNTDSGQYRRYALKVTVPQHRLRALSVTA